MHIPSLIEHKRDGGTLSTADIRALIAAFTRGDMPEYQMSALAMAIFFRGMDAVETSALTAAMLHSGTALHWPGKTPPRVDKHSTGGIGDKTSLILAPLLACDGLWVPMISGRGLGITGGTLDKLESIPGYRTNLSEQDIYKTVAEIGCVITGQTGNICPADKKLYALRDVTGTVPSIPLITASIMSKKLAEGLNRLVLDVKHGSGAFMKSADDAKALALAMIAVGREMGIHASATLNAMNEPTGEAAGNALEVAECVRCLKGNGPADLEEMTLDLCVAVSISGREQLREWLHDGTAWAKFQQMVHAQGGDVAKLEHIEQLHHAPFITEMKAPRSGIVQRMDAGIIGQVILELGGGRAKASDSIDFAVGCDQMLKVGAEVAFGEPLLRVHARTKGTMEAALVRLGEAVVIDQQATATV